MSNGLRILVGAGSFADASAGLHLVRHLQGSFCAGLGGILIEDAEMLAACAIPHQHIVLSSGTTARAPSLSMVQMLLKADARAFRKLLTHTAGPNGADCAFTLAKGELVSTALRAARDWDVLVLGYREIHKLRGKIVLLQSSVPSSDEMIQASRMLSNHMPDVQITYTIKTDGDAPNSDPSSNARQFATLPDALAALARTNAQTVLVDFKNGPIRNHGDLLKLLEVARCPVIVFGPSNLPTLLEHNTQIPANTSVANDG